MAKHNDPFAGAKLSQEVGLDQRLFEAQPVLPEPENENPEERTSVRKDERSSVSPEVPTAEGKSLPPEVGKAERPGGPPKYWKAGNREGRRSGRREATLAQWPGQKQRVIDHRPYDFFQDQIRWLNRRKLELEEEYGKRVTATAMVQLAVDLLIADYEANGEDSQVIRVLIKDERPSVRKAGSAKEQQATEAEEETQG